MQVRVFAQQPKNTFLSRALFGKFIAIIGGLSKEWFRF